MSFDERILNGMGVLTAIVESGSFAGASERLDMSQSGVSRSVARLEARLGIRLFDALRAPSSSPMKACVSTNRSCRSWTASKKRRHPRQGARPPYVDGCA